MGGEEVKGWEGSDVNGMAWHGIAGCLCIVTTSCCMCNNGRFFVYLNLCSGGSYIVKERRRTTLNHTIYIHIFIPTKSHQPYN